MAETGLFGDRVGVARQSQTRVPHQHATADEQDDDQPERLDREIEHGTPAFDYARW